MDSTLFWNRSSKVEGMREDRYKGVKFFCIVKKKHQVTRQTSSGARGQVRRQISLTPHCGTFCYANEDYNPSLLYCLKAMAMEDYWARGSFVKKVSQRLICKESVAVWRGPNQAIKHYTWSGCPSVLLLSPSSLQSAISDPSQDR